MQSDRDAGDHSNNSLRLLKENDFFDYFFFFFFLTVSFVLNLTLRGEKRNTHFTSLGCACAVFKEQ